MPNEHTQKYKIFNSSFFLANALGALVVLATLISTPSAPSERLFLNLSLPRLIFSIGFLLLFVVFTYLTYNSIRRLTQTNHGVNRILLKPAVAWSLLFSTFACSALAFLLLKINPQIYGRFQPILERFYPLLVWLVIFGFASSIFIFINNRAYFSPFIQEVLTSILWKELLIAGGMFVGLVAVRLLLVIPTAFGPVIYDDEFIFFQMADKLFKGGFTIMEFNHYPPLYPLSIFLAMGFNGSPYKNILFLNVLYSSSMVFPFYLLARQFLNRRTSLMVVILVAILPAPMYYMRTVMSENLYYPLLIWSVYLIFAIPVRTRLRLLWDILTGVSIGALLLTRYITLAILPALLFGWWLKPFEGESGFLRPGYKKIFHFTMLCLVGVIVYSPWIVFGRLEGVSYTNLLGFAIDSLNQNPLQLTSANLVMWIILYLCYSILIGAPLLNILSVNLQMFEWRHSRDHNNRFLLVVLVIMGLMLVASIRHSWKIEYNFPLPMKILGRYLVYFGGLFILLVAVGIERLKRTQPTNITWFAMSKGVMPITLIFVAYQVLLNKSFFEIGQDFVYLKVAPDAYIVKMMGWLFPVLILTGYVLTNYFLWKSNTKILRRVFFSFLFVYFIAGIPGIYAEIMNEQTFPRHGSEAAALIRPLKNNKLESEPFTVWIPADVSDSDQALMNYSLHMNGARGTILKRYSSQTSGFGSVGKTFRLLELKEGAPLPIAPLSQYQINGKTYAIMRVPSQ